MNEEKKFDLAALESDLQKSLFEKAESDIEIRRGELIVKKINAIANLERGKIELLRQQNEMRRLELEARRFDLEEIQTKYNIVSDMVRKSDKIQRAIGKTMTGIFPEQDKQVVQIMKSAQKLARLEESDV